MKEVEGGVFNHEWMGMDMKMGRKGATPRRFAPPLSRGDLWGVGGAWVWWRGKVMSGDLCMVKALLCRIINARTP
jgi:hypothetical protein